VRRLARASPRRQARGRLELQPQGSRPLIERFRADRVGLAWRELIEPSQDGMAVHPDPRQATSTGRSTVRRELPGGHGGHHERLAWDTVDETYARMRGSTRELPSGSRATTATGGGRRAPARAGSHGDARDPHQSLPWALLRIAQLDRVRLRPLRGRLHLRLRARRVRRTRRSDRSRSRRFAARAARAMRGPAGRRACPTRRAV